MALRSIGAATPRDKHGPGLGGKVHSFFVYLRQHPTMYLMPVSYTHLTLPTNSRV